MKKVPCCFGIIIILIIIFIVYDIHRISNIKNNHITIKSVMQHAIHNEKSFAEYQAVQSRWRLSNNHYDGVKIILYWNTMYVEKHRHFMFGAGDVFRDCNVPHCYATPNRQLLDSVKKYDAILFHGIEMNLIDLPRTRSPHQRYIYFSWESPLSRPINSHFVSWPNFYNWTMSYRLDSDIIRPYGIIRDILTQEIVFPPKNENDIINWRNPNEILYRPSDEELLIIKGKMQMAAWFVSHCKTLSYREYIVDKLRKFISVDIYGSCGELKCSRNKKEECYDIVGNNYFYYLSFENTLCKDYITEKLFLPMSQYIIPVVYGHGNYSKFLPPHSYINIYDFETIEELANFMIVLASDPYEYASYFWWKKYYRIEDSTKFTLCNLCEKLHDASLPKKKLKNFFTYYVKDQCYEINLKNTSNKINSP